MRKIIAHTASNKVQTDLSKYMSSCPKGAARAHWEMVGVINDQPTAEAICEELNEDPWTSYNFRPYRTLDNGFLLIATDPWGNEDIIQITEDED